LIGLPGAVFERVVADRIGVSRRFALRVIFALGGNGTAKGDCKWAVVDEMPADDGLGGGERGEGDSGEVGGGDFEVTSRNVGPLDGDLESERRNDLIAAVSGW
jgi:hypothetical protein